LKEQFVTLADWAAVAEIVGVVTILASLVYLNIQFRQAKKNDERDAAFELIRSFQTPEFTKMMQFTFDLPVGLSRGDLDARLGDDLPAFYAFLATWESLGIMVHRRQIGLDLVCDFFSHPIRHSWAVADTYVMGLRKDLQRETPWEWFQWLAERVKDYESREQPVPAYIEFKNWI